MSIPETVRGSFASSREFPTLWSATPVGFSMGLLLHRSPGKAHYAAGSHALGKNNKAWRQMRIVFAAQLLVCLICGCTSPNARKPNLVYSPGDVGEPASFWASLANDSSLPDDCRRVCALELFRRHVHPGMSLGEAWDTLEHPNWLAERDFQALIWSGSAPPLGQASDESSFWFAIFPDPTGAHPCIVYIRVKGEFRRPDFLLLLDKDSRRWSVREARITGLAVLEPPNYERRPYR